MSSQKKEKLETVYKVGVFDSGMGGLSVARYIQTHVPSAEVIFTNDSENVPYGDKSMELVYGLVLPILEGLVEQGCQVIVIACNTVTTNLIDKLREKLSIPLIGLEPMVKQAAHQTNSKIIAVCATPATLSSDRYHWLVENYAKDISVIEPDCSNWSRMIESSDVDHEFITQQIKEVCKQGADVIVLGCTHYHWIETLILKAAEGRALVLQPEQPVTRQLVAVLDEISSGG